MSNTQRIAVAVEGPGGLDAPVSAHFGQCTGFVVVDVEDCEIVASHTEPNPFAQAHQPGALPKVIQSLGVDVLLSGGMGPKAQTMLSRFGIDVATGASGQVREAVQAYLKGDLRGFTPCADHGGHNSACGGRHHHA